VRVCVCVCVCECECVCADCISPAYVRVCTGEEELHGHMFPAPANAAAVLEVDYGPDFMTPEAKVRT
jgi:hypothetical protein